MIATIRHPRGMPRQRRIIRNAILAALREKNMTRYQLAQQIGIAPKSIYRMLGKEGNMTEKYADACMRVLGLEVVPAED